MGEIENKYNLEEKIERENFSYKVIHPYLEEINYQKDFIDIEVDVKGKKFIGSMTTTKFIDERLKKYRLTNENKKGSYFCAKGMIVVKDLKDKTIKKTLLDLIEREDLQEFFDSN
jgi:hypothetical protein